MFHPVGSQPPSVYWRRRLLVFGSIVIVLVLAALTIKAAASGGDSNAAGSPNTSKASSPARPSTTIVTSTNQSSSAPASGRSTGTSASATPVACASKDLAVAAVAGQKSYSVGDQPLLELQVTNTGATPCVQDLSDKQIELRVYNGESRVWGSHDCQIQPGTDDKTLASHTPIRVAITWSGLTSQPGCAGTRQRVGAGTYTLYAALSGQTGKATQFTIS